MKKTFFLIAAAAALVFTGCQKESEENNGQKATVFSATVEQQIEAGATKSYLENNNVKWSEGDAIKVFYTGGSYQFVLSSGEGTVTGKFSYGGEVSGTPQYAIYPYSADASLSGSTITFTLPAVQTYYQNSFGNGANVAVAQVTSHGMLFYNVCGSLKLQLKGSMNVKRIELVGNNNEKLNGTFSVDASTASTTGAAAVGAPIDAEKKLTLNCGNGVQLDSETPTNFYFVVPVGAFAGGFTATVYDVEGDTYSTAVSTTSDNNVCRSQARRMPSKKVSLLPTTFTEMKYIKSSGTQYCNTSILVSNNNKFDSKVKFDAPLSSTKGRINGGYAVIINNAKTFRNDYAGVTAGGNSFFVGLSDVSVVTNYPADTNVHRFKIDCVTGEWSIDDVCGAVTPYTGSIPGETSIFVFARNSTQWGTEKYFCRENLYYLRIWTSNLLVSYLVPARRNSDSELGLYNIVNGEFLTNLGTGTFASDVLVD